MSTREEHDDRSSVTAARDEYQRTLYRLRVQLVKLQNHVIRKGLRLAVVLEGRDGAGKDGAIKRIVKNMSPRETRVVALGKPSNREESGWYFQRFSVQLPTGGEIVLFNRSWYNRAGVERVMGFCTAAEHESFLEDAPRFEDLLLRSGMMLRKYYLDISKGEQKRRLKSRERDPLTQWKVSPIDDVAIRHWTKYSEARDEMLARTSTERAPWVVIGTDDKRAARIGVMKALLASVDYKGKDDLLLDVDRSVAWSYDEKQANAGRLAR